MQDEWRLGSMGVEEMYEKQRKAKRMNEVTQHLSLSSSSSAASLLRRSFAARVNADRLAD